MSIYHIISLAQILGVSNQVIYLADTQSCHVFPQLLCYKLHKVLNILRLAAEPLAQLRILGCDTHRTSIKITHTHHDTAHCYEWCRCKSELLCTKQCCDQNVSAGHELSIRLHDNTIPQTIHEQRLMCLCDTQLPRKSCVVNRTSRCSARTAVITGHKDNLCTRFCNTGCNRSHSCFRYELDGNSGIGIGIF